MVKDYCQYFLKNIQEFINLYASDKKTALIYNTNYVNYDYNLLSTVQYENLKDLFEANGLDDV